MPGQWRPHYPFEHIAWVSPPWPSQDYVWLDFPEAIFTSQGLVFLSHINPSVPSLYPALPKVAWRVDDEGIAFERELPNGAWFAGRVFRKNSDSVGLLLSLRNGTSEPLRDIKLQTCVFLRACREFADYTMENKFVHTRGGGWMRYGEALEGEGEEGSVSLGWRGGPKRADLPMMVARSNQAERWVAMTWHEHTNSLVGNPGHPCFHADPFFEDLEPGEEATIRGTLLFGRGALDVLSES